ncbi:MAG: ribonuclease Y [Oscillospiraceae bacterium]|jgi:ribonuclease Y|nr:ribonuclease Y [Oscillospiraceae bacterium]
MFCIIGAVRRFIFGGAGQLEIWIVIVLILLCGILSGLGGFFVGNKYRNRLSNIEIGSAKEKAKNIMDDAVKEAEIKKRDIVLRGKDEIIKFKTDTDKEISETRKEIARQERKIQEKEENFDKKLNQLDVKHEMIANKTKAAQEKLNEAELIKKQQADLLEEISGFTREQAKKSLLDKLDEELDHEKALKIREFERQIKSDSDKKAREILSVAVQRMSAEHVSESTISVVVLPNEDMKGRIIGREGRNIRSIETLTGVDLIIDDTPEVITLSTFDPVRREIARIALEKLILDGRIHPAKIEEMIEKAKQEVEETIKSEGERAVLEAKLTSIHPDLVNFLGRLHYRTSYGQNVLSHSLEVSHLCDMISCEMGLDSVLARRAGLLHDIGKAFSHNVEGSHVEVGVDIARKYKENPDVIHAIEAHHGDVDPQTAIACIVQAADAVSAARPGARRENIESYIKRLKKLEELALSFEGVEYCFAIQAGREVRIVVNPKLIKEDAMVLLARDVCKKVESDLSFPGQIKINIIRENRVMKYAK